MADGPDTARIYDEFLVTLLWSGDRRAAERLARRWYPRLLRTARRMLGDEEQARGAVQECWVSILRGIDGLKDPARFPPWAFGILRRRCADAIRNTSRMRRDLDSGEPPEVGGEWEAEDALAIRQAFARLPEDQRLAAQLFFVEGLSLAEIAYATGIPLGTAKTRIFHARRKLKAALKGDE